VHGDAPQQELELGAQPDAVPLARRFAASVLNGRPPDLVGDAELIVTELVTNALLYAGPPVTLRVVPRQDRVRLEVVDHSRALPMRLVESTEAMTGRGLALVESLSQRTGVEPLANGKVVWCELTGEPPADSDTAEIDIDALLASWPEDEPEPERPYTVRLGEVPTDLLLAAKAHVDNVVREFALAASGAASGTTTALPPHLAELIDTVVHRFAEVRHAVKQQAAAAARHEQERTELTLTLPLSAAEAGEDYLAALDEIDVYARAARLLTLESPPQHRIFRRWYVETLIAQLRSTARGQSRPPQTFESRLLQEVGVLAAARIVADRATRLQAVTAALAKVASPGQVAGIAVAEGVAALRAVGGSLLVPKEQGGFRVESSVGYPEELVRRLDEEAVDAELPAAFAARTGQAVWLESVADRDNRFPELKGLEPGTVAMCAVPLQLAGECLGAMRFGFDDNRLFDDAERGFVTALAAQTSQALARARLYDEQRAARAAAEALAARLARLQQLSGDLAGVRTIPDAVNLIVEHAAGSVGAQVAVLSLVEGDKLNIRGITGVPEDAIAPWRMSPLDAPLPANEAARTGQMVVIPTSVEFARRYPAAGTVTDRPAQAFICLPLKVDLRRVGALSLFFDDNHAVDDPGELTFLTGLADGCAQALDRILVLDEVRDARERLRFLADASAILSRSLDYRTTLTTIARLVVPALADFCSICILDNGVYDTVAIAHKDPQRAAEAEELSVKVPIQADDPTGVPEVIRTGRSEFVPVITREMFEVAPVHPELARQGIEWGVTSSVTVPMTGRTGTFGALQLLYADSGRHYDERDLELLEDLARRAAVAVENARAFEARPSG
jgi:GAF domain-containing protein/anti-sigma regulatory factor (Ser/Thr protein kinase)